MLARLVTKVKGALLNTVGFMQVSKLKGHWETIVDNSTVWRGQIDYLMEEWKRFVELREELLEWIRKAEAYLESDETVYGYTVSELEEQIDKHKVIVWL